MEWPRKVIPLKDKDPNGAPGVPIQYYQPINNETVEPGFAYEGGGQIEESGRFFYHGDHLGSTGYVTDARGRVSQYVAYMPYGETLFEQHSNSREMPYLFNGKERDEETGLYYYGARYYDSEVATWMGVDPLAMKYSDFGGYVYCMGSPVVLIDPNGMDPDPPEQLPWYLGPNSSGGKPVLTLGLHNLKFTPYQRQEVNSVSDAGVFAVNTLGALYNNFAGLWNSGLEGVTGAEMMDAAISSVENFSVDDLKKAETYENIGAMIIGAKIMKGTSKGSPKISAVAVEGAVAKGISWGKISGIVRDAAKGKGNFGLGTGSLDEAMTAGRSWVGDGFKIASDGKTMVSGDGLRQFRPPSFKPRLGKTQANFEWRNINQGQWQGNGHLDVIGE